MTRPTKHGEKMGTVVRVRITSAQRAKLQQAADHEGRDLSDWLRRLALKEADRVSARAAKRAAREE